MVKGQHVSYFSQPIAETIWDIKYRYHRHGRPMETDIEQTWQRVAAAAVQPEKAQQRHYWRQQFLNSLIDFTFLPGGRILAGAGTQNEVTLFNCFVMNIKQDSLHGIFDALKEGALTLQRGGGIGYDFSVLRPQGEITLHTSSTASGPVSFMRIWDTMSSIMQSSGARRGAMMATMRCDHPDIETFIAAKSDPGQLRQFNVSVVVTDEFMQAVEQDAQWALVFPSHHSKSPINQEIIWRRWSGSEKPVACRVFRYVRARELWQRIIKSAYEFAEPGVLFEGTINRMNPLWYCETISATNPCGEIPLPPYGACNLGSINLTQFVVAPFTENAKIDWEKIEQTTFIATRFLDNVINISKYPLRAQQIQAYATRRIGLGITGLADMLVMLGIRYGSAAAVETAKQIMRTIAQVTWETSVELAREKGVFPRYQKQLYLAGKFVRRLPREIRTAIAKYGIRNSHHNTIAPAGTISLLANNISSGIEPIFAAFYERNVRALSGDMLKFNIIDAALQLWQSRQPAAPLPPAWIDAQTLVPEEHLAMQGAMQPFIDNAISKTINIPVDFPFEKLQEVYTKAYQIGLKGCTIFRPNPITGSVLSSPEVEPCCQLK